LVTPESIQKPHALRSRHRRRKLLAQLLLCLVSWAPGLSPAFAAELAPTRQATRLGDANKFTRYGSTTKANNGAKKLTLPVTTTQPHRLLLAAANEGPRPATCSAVLTGGVEPPRTLFEEDLPGGNAEWREFEVDFPIVKSGTLTLECKKGKKRALLARFAQPFLIPVEQGSTEAAPLVVVLSIDTLRADHVTGFGGAADMTPNLARLQREGTRMLAATSEATWTLPSHWALLNSAIWGFRKDSREQPTLQRVLNDNGFASVAVTGGGWMNQLAFNFDHYSDHWQENSADLSRVVPEAIRWIDKLQSVSTFLLVHTYAVHEPSAAFTAWFRGHVGNEDAALYQPTPEVLKSDLAWYTKLVRDADRELLPLFEKLRAVSKTRKVLLIVLSDHGEGFGEHGFFGHGQGDLDSTTLHDELTHIPVIVWGPGLIPADSTSTQPMMLSDVAPSILSAAGIKTPSFMRGNDLWPVWSGADVGAEQTRGSLSHTEHAWAYRTDSVKLVARIRDEANEQDEFELFDLKADPRATRDIAKGNPELLSRARSALESMLTRYGLREPGSTLSRSGLPVGSCTSPFWRHCGVGKGKRSVATTGVDQQTYMQLRALGYLGNEEPVGKND